MALIIVSLVFVLLFPKELTGMKCYTCDNVPDCNKEKNELVCPQEPLMMDRCLLMIDNENGKVARSCSNDKLCGIANKTCNKAKEARTGDCDLECCATDLCNAGSTVSPFRCLSVFFLVVVAMLNIVKF